MAMSGTVSGHKRPRPTSPSISPMTEPEDLRRAPAGTGAGGLRSRVIAFIDFDCYYVQCAKLLDPSLEGKSIGIVQKYLVVTCSYEARAKGVGKLMRTTEALERCPELTLVNGEDLTWFRLCSDAVLEYLNTRLAQMYKAVGLDPPGPLLVERLVLEEYWLDLSAIVAAIHSDDVLASALACLNCTMDDVKTPTHVWESSAKPDEKPAATPFESLAAIVPRPYLVGSMLTRAFRAGIRSTFNLTCCGGTGDGKMTAKMAAGMNKPNNQAILLPKDAKFYLQSRNLRDLPGVGSRTAKALAAAGLTKVLDLSTFDVERLKSVLKHAEQAQESGPSFALEPEDLLNLSVGKDTSEVQPSQPAHTLSDEDSFKTASTWEKVGEILTVHLHGAFGKVLVDALRHRRTPTSIRVSVRHNRSYTDPQEAYGHRVSKSRPIPPELFLSDSQLDEIASALPSWMVFPMQHFATVMSTASDKKAVIYAPTSQACLERFTVHLKALRRLAGECLKDLLGAPPSKSGAAPVRPSFNISLLSVAFANFVPCPAKSAASMPTLDKFFSSTLVSPAQPAVAPKQQVSMGGTRRGIAKFFCGLRSPQRSAEVPTACVELLSDSEVEFLS